MGNHLAVPVLSSFISDDKWVKGKFKNLFFAASDFDKQSFMEAVEDIFKNNLAENMVCYSSCKDQALQFSESKLCNGKPRTGFYRKEMKDYVCSQYIHSVIGDYSHSAYQHGYHSEREVVEDMKNCLRKEVKQSGSIVEGIQRIPVFDSGKHNIWRLEINGA